MSQKMNSVIQVVVQMKKLDKGLNQYLLNRKNRVIKSQAMLKFI